MRQKKYQRIITKTNSGHNYYMYLIKVQYSDIYKIKFQSTKNFLSMIPYLDKKYKEKSDIRWVSIETIENSLKDRSWISLRTVFQNTFINNLESIKTKCWN